MHSLEAGAIIEGRLAKAIDIPSKGDGFKLDAITEGYFANIADTIGQDDGYKIGIFCKG